MVQITGTYEFVSSENYEEYLASVGLNPEQVQKASERKSPFIISSADDKQISILFGPKERTFIYGEEVEYTLPVGLAIKTIVSASGDTITFKSKIKDGLSEERVIKVTDTGLTTITTTSKGVVTKREYKRV